MFNVQCLVCVCVSVCRIFISCVCYLCVCVVRVLCVCCACGLCLWVRKLKWVMCCLFGVDESIEINQSNVWNKNMKTPWFCGQTSCTRKAERDIVGTPKNCRRRRFSHNKQQWHQHQRRSREGSVSRTQYVLLSEEGDSRILIFKAVLLSVPLRIILATSTYSRLCLDRNIIETNRRRKSSNKVGVWTVRTP